MPEQSSAYPSIDKLALLSLALSTGRFEDPIVIGRSTAIVAKGKQPIFKRTTILREIEPGQITFEQATGLAIKHGFMSALLTWFEQNKQWKDGGYFVI